MSEALFALVPQYGGWLVLAATFLSCLALPVPSSLMMLAAGGFAASGELSLGLAVAAALVGAILGDQAGFVIGRRGGAPLVARLRHRARIATTVERAAATLDRGGARAVFLTRWLFSPLGPYVNFLGGALGLGWRRFTLGSVTGESVWVGTYTGLGYGFGSHIALISELAGNLSGLLAAGLVSVLLGRRLLRKRPPHG
jgi:membrane protein DedA with SNARE-associated domain